MEGSKVFMKELLKKHKISTGHYEVFADRAAAVRYIESQTPPLVVKADGLAAGKGVILADSVEEAVQAVDLIMVCSGAEG